MTATSNKLTDKIKNAKLFDNSKIICIFGLQNKTNY